VTFDFIVKLPKTSQGNDSIRVFVSSSLCWCTLWLARKRCLRRNSLKVYVDHIFCLHGLSREFLTDCDARFTSAFWQEVTILLGTRTAMSSSFHPQSDGQTERVNQTLEMYLQHFFSVELNGWDTLLSRVDFAHNAA
jgi:hypothetical protein